MLVHRVVPLFGTLLSVAMYVAPLRSVLLARKRGALEVGREGCVGAVLGRGGARGRAAWRPRLPSFPLLAP